VKKTVFACLVLAVISAKKNLLSRSAEATALRGNLLLQIHVTRNNNTLTVYFNSNDI
jgi:hypothetical protein